MTRLEALTRALESLELAAKTIRDVQAGAASPFQIHNARMLLRVAGRVLQPHDEIPDPAPRPEFFGLYAPEQPTAPVQTSAGEPE